MQAYDDEYIAYRPDKYIHANGENPKADDEDEFAYEKTLPDFKFNQFMNDYNSLAASDISFKRVKREETETQDPLDKGNGGGDAVRQSNTIPLDEGGEIKLFLTPIFALTAFFAVIFIIGPFLVRKGPNKGIVQCCIMLSAFCMWIFWVTVYIGQMNPLMGPRLENTTVAWIAVKVVQINNRT